MVLVYAMALEDVHQMSVVEMVREELWPEVDGGHFSLSVFAYVVLPYFPHVHRLMALLHCVFLQMLCVLFCCQLYLEGKD